MEEKKAKQKAYQRAYYLTRHTRQPKVHVTLEEKKAKQKAYQLVYCQTHKKQRREYMRGWEKRNRDKIKKYNDKRAIKYKNNEELLAKSKAYQKAYYQTHKEQHREAMRRYVERNKKEVVEGVKGVKGVVESVVVKKRVRFKNTYRKKARIKEDSISALGIKEYKRRKALNNIC